MVILRRFWSAWRPKKPDADASPAAVPVPTPPTAPKSSQSPGWEWGWNEDWVRIGCLNFYGKAHYSANRWWILALADSDGHGRGGFRESGFGQVVTIDQRSGAIVTHLSQIARPWVGGIADDGTFVVSDAGFGKDLTADLTVYAPGGTCLYRREFAANMYNVAIDPSGRYVVSQTCHADNPDGNLLELVEVATSTVIFSKRSEAGWADHYVFELVGGRLSTLWVELKRLGRLAYDRTGQFDVEAFTEAQLARGDISERIIAAQRIMAGTPTPEQLERVIVSIEAALTERGTWHEQWLAQAYRALGEARELRGQLQEALAAFDAALTRNPKVGVKRKTDALRKKLSASA